MAQAPNPTGVMFKSEFPNLRVLTGRPQKMAVRTTHRAFRAGNGLGARRSLNKFFEAEALRGAELSDLPGRSMGC